MLCPEADSIDIIFVPFTVPPGKNFAILYVLVILSFDYVISFVGGIVKQTMKSSAVEVQPLILDLRQHP
jgi:hypothetical protein